ncbi:hypothetical protein N9N67_09100 [Bacteriovoracaceae bacterium]|nr:hypothetical protein [Bacteriovoracaceae bacterium]
MKVSILHILLLSVSLSINLYSQSTEYKIKNQNNVNVYDFLEKARMGDILLKPWWKSMRELMKKGEYQTCDGRVQLVPNVFFTNKSNLHYAKFKEKYIRNGTRAYTPWDAEDVEKYLNTVGERPIHGIDSINKRNHISSDWAHPFQEFDILAEDFDGEIEKYSLAIAKKYHDLVEKYKAYSVLKENSEEEIEKVEDYRCTSSVSFVLTEKRTKEYGIGFHVNILHHWYNPAYDRVMVDQYRFLDIPLAALVNGNISSTYIITSLFQNNGKIQCSIYPVNSTKEKYSIKLSSKLNEEKHNEREALQGAELFEYLRDEGYYGDFYKMQLSVDGKNYELSDDGFSFDGIEEEEKSRVRLFKTWKINQNGTVPVRIYNLETKDGFIRKTPLVVSENDRQKAKDFDPFVSKKEVNIPLSILVKQKPIFLNKKKSLFEEMNVSNCVLEI